MNDTLTKLKSIAKAATQDGWEKEIWCSDHDNAWVSIGPVHKQDEEEGYELDPESNAGKLAEIDAKYIATMNPSTILALFDLLEAYQEAIEFHYGDYSESMLGKKETEILERIKKGAGL